MKSIIVFYSFDGNTKFLAQEMAQEIGADLSEIKPENEFKSHGFTKYLWGVKQIVMNQKPKLLPIEKNLNDYDLIIIGCPVWASTFAPPLKTFFSEVKIKGKKIALFCSCEKSQGNTINNMKKELSGNEFVAEMVFSSPLKSKNENSNFAKDFVKKLI